MYNLPLLLFHHKSPCSKAVPSSLKKGVSVEIITVGWGLDQFKFPKPSVVKTCLSLPVLGGKKNSNSSSCCVKFLERINLWSWAAPVASALIIMLLSLTSNPWVLSKTFTSIFSASILFAISLFLTFKFSYTLIICGSNAGLSPLPTFLSSPDFRSNTLLPMYKLPSSSIPVA